MQHATISNRLKNYIEKFEEVTDLEAEYAQEQAYQKRCQEDHFRMIQARNAYKPNIAFDGLKTLLKNVA